ncbi:hypothetical protein N7510_008631 [Penicillium lagena]|uniref:uncharacterized protein n=1 Tax=Penicillium lagena TaxID=94218 RepID=UPI0025402597|nr:uncharacterized protein N7510_008631 [Penicillium lagena]KAJ5605850.1 hypothetical protein N7510_008631 [Penicillium lagena]
MAPFLTPEKIKALESILGYIFKSKSLLDKSMESGGATEDQRDNRDLAHVGDAAIRLSFYLDGYNRNGARGTTSVFHDMNASNANLALIGRSRGLDEYIHVNRSQQGQVFNKVMATAVEAIIGAVFIDSDHNIAVVQIVLVTLGILQTS